MDLGDGVEYKGNIDLDRRPFLRNGDGSISTESSFSFQDDREQKEILIPSIIEGRRWSEDDSIGNYYKTGQHLGKFDIPKDKDGYKAIDDYANKIHNRQAVFYKRFMK